MFVFVLKSDAASVSVEQRLVSKLGSTSKQTLGNRGLADESVLTSCAICFMTPRSRLSLGLGQSTPFVSERDPEGFLRTPSYP